MLISLWRSTGHGVLDLYAFAARKMYVVAVCTRMLPPQMERALPARMVEDVDPHRLGSHSKRPGKAGGAASPMHRAAVEPLGGY